jgi:hypothetical protein
MAKKNKNEKIDTDPCANGCKVENFKFSRLEITEYKDRKSIKVFYVCSICGKKH